MTRTVALALVLTSLSATSIVTVAEAKTPSEEARDHYTAGTKAFDLTHYDEAIAEFEAAYRAKDDAVFLYNIAQAHRLAGHLDKAIRFYRNYLRLAPDSPVRSEIEHRITEMERALETQRNQFVAPPSGTIAPAGAPPKSEPEKPIVTETSVSTPPSEKVEPYVAAQSQPVGAPKKVLLFSGIGVAAGGLVALIAGVALGATARSKAGEIETAAMNGSAFDPNVDSSRKTLNGAGIALDIIGPVLLAGGGVLAFLGWRSMRGSEAPKSALNIVPAVSGRTVGMSLGGSF